MEHLCKHLESLNVYSRIGALSKVIQGGTLNEFQIEEFNKVESSITEGMLAAEKQLPRRCKRGWTAELNKMIHPIRYYWLLLQRNRGLKTHETVMKKMRELAAVTWDGYDEQEIKSRIHRTWRCLDEHQKKVVEKEKIFSRNWQKIPIYQSTKKPLSYQVKRGV